MKDTSKVIMGATLIMVVSLAFVLGLVLVLLAELYCSLLLRRRRRVPTTASSAVGITPDRANVSSPSQTSYPQGQSPPPPFTSIYTHGVLQAPRSFLFPTVSSDDDDDIPEPKKHHSQLRHFIQIQTQASNASPHHRIGLVSASSPPQKPLLHEGAVQVQGSVTTVTVNGSICDKSSCGGEHLVYISNPIYENDERKSSSGADASFKTPDTSPSCLERSGSSGGDDDVAAPPESRSGSPPCTPPLSPMKKLPAEACSVSLRDARSLGTSGSPDSNSVNALSSSSSASPCTSPSW